MPSPATLPRRTDRPGHARVPLMLSVEGTASTVASRLHHAGLAPGGALRWGTEPAHVSMLCQRPAMILLDAPATDADTLTRLVRAASLVAPVAVLGPAGDPLVAFDAGAHNVFDPQAPFAELAWRIRADLRRCSPPSPAPGCPRGTVSQRLLYDVLARARSAVCCHQLRLLLGTPALPMTLRALRPRVQRLLPIFHQHGLELVVDQQWGLATYRTRPLTSGPATAGRWAETACTGHGSE